MNGDDLIPGEVLRDERKKLRTEFLNFSDDLRIVVDDATMSVHGMDMANRILDYNSNGRGINVDIFVDYEHGPDIPTSGGFFHDVGINGGTRMLTIKMEMPTAKLLRELAQLCESWLILNEGEDRVVEQASGSGFAFP
jgi:hypothetical protein